MVIDFTFIKLIDENSELTSRLAREASIVCMPFYLFITNGASILIVFLRRFAL